MKAKSISQYLKVPRPSEDELLSYKNLKDNPLPEFNSMDSQAEKNSLLSKDDLKDGDKFVS